MALKQHDLGNNDSIVTGYTTLAPGDHGGLPNGGFMALTRVQSKAFKTEGGAIRWLAARGYNPDGTRSEQTPAKSTAQCPTGCCDAACHTALCRPCCGYCMTPEATAARAAVSL